MTAATAIPTGKAIRVGETAHRISQSHPAFAGREVPATRRATGLNFPDKGVLDDVARDIVRYDSLVALAENVLGDHQTAALIMPDNLRDIHDRVSTAANRAARAINDMATDFDVLPEILQALALYRLLISPEYLYSQEGSISKQIEVASVRVIDAARKLYTEDE